MDCLFLMRLLISYNKDIDLGLAEQIVRRAVRFEKKPVTVDHILETVCGYFNVGQNEIFTKSRKQNIVQVRQIAMYLAQKYTDLSSSKIGALIGKRNHATVLHSCNLVADRLKIDKSFKQKFEDIEAILKKPKG